MSAIQPTQQAQEVFQSKVSKVSSEFAEQKVGLTVQFGRWSVAVEDRCFAWSIVKYQIIYQQSYRVHFMVV